MTIEAVTCNYCRHEMPLTQYYLDSKNEAVKKIYGKIEIQHAAAFLYLTKRE